MKNMVQFEKPQDEYQNDERLAILNLHTMTRGKCLTHHKIILCKR